MRLIVTHEQADFDAIASLVGAHLLDPQGLALLPRRLNRNVRAFLTLYGNDLPLVDHDDLPRGRVEILTLVDAQAIPSLKGVGRQTQVHVVDHHRQDRELDPSWTHHIEDVGATTTLIVEAIQDVGVELDGVSATLLLLGIYEDTGSLSYAGTTSRDMRASAWLLEAGASLVMAAEFLDHPLSSAQRQVYEKLLEAAEVHTFHGLSVVVACAEAPELVDEISSLAHKLRDVFDPAGLFVLVALDSSVQMVARSTSNLLDVGAIAAHFGGGGHERAAAALIRDRNLVDVRMALLEMLPKAIKPPRSVGEIMSRGPQLLEANVTVREAADRMQRFGHEGYPVVERGQVVGLLTRRAVDRAMSHGMGERPVSSVMNAGQWVVYPSDPVQHLQQLMIEHDWGQVPVADAKSGEIIGIVTRTDLLQILAPPEVRGVMPDVARKLEQALPPARLKLLKLVAQRAEAQNDALYIVGGFVRDLLLGAPSVDFDLVVEGNAIRLARDLARHFGGSVSSHRQFGTAKWRLEASHPSLSRLVGDVRAGQLPASLDFVTARTEFYSHPTALPSVRSGSIKLDLHRRDFTINTLALRLDGRFYGQLLDHWGGGADLQQGLIRVLHSLSFVDDPTRALRAVRLEQRLRFHIEQRTLELLKDALPLLGRVSGERVFNELDLILREEQLLLIMARLQELGLLAAIHPALRWDEWRAEHLPLVSQFSPPSAWRLAETPPRQLLLLAQLLFPLSLLDAQAVCDRLKLPLASKTPLLQAVRLGAQLPQLAGKSSPSQVVTLLEGAHETALVAIWLAMAEQPNARQAVESYLRQWRFVAPKADGNTLRELGLRPGPHYKRILWRLRAAWLDGELRTQKQERKLLERLVAEVRGRGQA